MQAKKSTKAKPAKRGPKPETLKIEGPWEEAVGKAVKKPPPPPSKEPKKP